MTKNRSTILFINGKNSKFDFLQLALEKEGLDFISAACSREGLSLAMETSPEIILINAHGPDIEIFECLSHLNETINAPVIIISSKIHSKDIAKIFEKGAFDFISHPINIHDLKNKIHNALDYRKNMTAMNANNLDTHHIIQLLENIDQKIIELNDASNKDFNHLHHNFKSLHHESIVIISNIKKAQYILKGPHSKAIVQNLADGFKNCKDYFTKQESIVDELLSLIEKIQFKFEQIYIPLYNFKQNLLTLKLIISKNDLRRENPGGNGEPPFDISKSLDDFKTVYDEIEQTFNEIKDYTKETYSYLKDFQNELSNEKVKYNVDFQNADILFDDKNSLSLKKEFGIEDITKLGYENIEEIITNLQYHDIIRQKIEHIQLTHNDLLKELAELNESSEQKDNEKFLYNIKYIAELQSAQLIHTNKKYQTAIKIIVDELLTLGNKIGSVNNHLESFFHYTREDKFTSLSTFKNNLNECLDISGRTGELNENHLKHAGIICEKLHHLKSSFLKIEAIKNSIRDRYSGTKEAQLPDQSYPGIKNQMKTVFNEINDVNDIIQQTLTDVTCYGEQLRDNIGKLVKPREVIDRIAGNLREITSHRDEFEKELNSVLADNRELTAKINQNIKSLVKEVKYYDFFESTVDKIILDFNELIKNKESLGKQSEENQEDLEKIKERYTMKSEHEIHESLANSKFGPGNDHISEDEDDSGELELF